MDTWQWLIAAVAFLVCGILIERHTGDEEGMFTGVVLMGAWGVSVICIFKVIFRLWGE